MRMAPIDYVSLAILTVTVMRGLSLGLVREAFSIGALVAAVIAVRVWNEPFGHWLEGAVGNALPHYLLPWVSGALLATGVAIAVGTFGRTMRSGVRAVGLGPLDRLGGALVGGAKGALIAGTLLFIAGTLLGRSHALLATSRSYALLERAEHWNDMRTPDVAAPPQPR